MSDDSDEIDPDPFDEFWRQYPRKDAKQDARKAWKQIMKKVDPQTVIEGLASYRFNPDRQFVPLPASWLRGQRWEDEGATVTPIRPADPHAGMEKWYEIQPGQWQRAHPDGVYDGKRSQWVPIGGRPA